MKKDKLTSPKPQKKTEFRQEDRTGRDLDKIFNQKQVTQAMRQETNQFIE
jgi:hypothetical protein